MNFKGHDSRIYSLVVSSDDCQLFAATYGKILIYDIHNGQLLEILNCLHFLPVTCLKVFFFKLVVEQLFIFSISRLFISKKLMTYVLIKFEIFFYAGLNC